MEGWFRRDVGRLGGSKELLRRWIERKPAAKNLVSIHREIASLEHYTSTEVVEGQRNRAWDLALSSQLASADLERQLSRISESVQTALRRLNELKSQLAQVNEAHRSIEQARR
jgi:hypothetical protein